MPPPARWPEGLPGDGHRHYVEWGQREPSAACGDAGRREARDPIAKGIEVLPIEPR
jgi:hypothetical protein